ncbi:hypothetical protein JP74_04465 [Devosia sp. 17-2-E-8]|nr:hypothetical protein JP74_04465 [Devosia sp. 17-2-E-8]
MLDADRSCNPTPYPSAPGQTVEDILVCPSIFQQRDLSENSHAREQHIRTLKESIGDARRPQYLEPLTIWWGGRGWYLIDGHHRLEAYERLGILGTVPVVIFEGTPAEALAKSAEGNSRDKLPMSPQEKLNAAMRLELCTGMSQAEIQRATGASRSSIKTIRRTLRGLRDAGHTAEELADLSWREVDRLYKGDASQVIDFDEITRQKAERIMEAIFKVVGPNLTSNVDAIALALSQMSPALPTRLQESFYWEGSGPQDEESPEDGPE